MKPPVFDYVAPTAVEEAVALLEQARARSPRWSPSIQYRLGVALAATGDTAGARRMFEKSLARGDIFGEAEQAREALAALDAEAP